MAHMQTKVVELISKPPRLRSDHRIQIVLPWLRKKSQLFVDMNKDVLTDVIRNCDYQKCTVDDVIIRQGEMGNCFYIMLTGRTSVYIDTVQTDSEEEDHKIVESGNCVPKSENDMDLDESDFENATSEVSVEKKEPSDRSKFGKFIMNYESGKSFGEVALMSEDSVRNASIIADEDTDLLVISRDLFNRSVKAKQEEEYEERKEFIENNPYFRNWSLKFRRLLELSIRKEVYTSGSLLMKQGDPVLGLVFILSGQAKVTVQPAKYQQQFPLLIKQDINPVAQEIGRDNYNRLEKKVDHTFRQSQVQIRRTEGYAAAEKRIMGKKLDICCIEANDLLGDIEMSLELEKNLFTVTCTENTTVMLLDIKNYDRLIAKRHQATINSLCRCAYQKLKIRLQNDHLSKIPLLSILYKKLRDKLIVKTLVPERNAEKNKSEVLKILIDMFLKGKVPLIEPFVPDALVYKQKSERRARMIEIQNKKNQDLSEKVQDRLYGTRKRTRVARSMKQLRNVKTENELLKASETITDLAPRASTTLIRPRTAIGFQMEATTSSSTNGRPQTAGIFRLTESSKAEEGSILPVIPSDGIDADVEDIVERLDYVQRGKNENRSRVLCSAIAASGIKQNMRNGGFSTSSIDDPFDEEYFDWETSEKNLYNLENRIRQFCSEEGSNKRPASVSSLRRFCIKDDRNEETLELNVPKPGGTVFVKKKPCQLKIAHQEVEGHAHVRRFIVTREDQDILPVAKRRPKSASPISLRKDSFVSLGTVSSRPRTSISKH